MLDRLLKTMMASGQWERMAGLIIDQLPALPDDGTPRSNTPERVVFVDVLRQIDAPAVIVQGMARYLDQASDAQLATLAGYIHELHSRLQPVLVPHHMH